MNLYSYLFFIHTCNNNLYLAPNGLFLLPKFQTQTEDSGIYIFFFFNSVPFFPFPRSRSPPPHFDFRKSRFAVMVAMGPEKMKVWKGSQGALGYVPSQRLTWFIWKYAHGIGDEPNLEAIIFKVPC